jgi:SNF2 family DNA or RNA helicase
MPSKSTMTIRNHPRGFLVSIDDRVSRNALIHQLEARSQNSSILVFQKDLIVPLNQGADLLSLVKRSHDVNWEPEALRKVEDQSTHREMQSEAKLEVANALQNPRKALKGYDKMTRLDPHQVSAVAALTTSSLRGLALFDEQGTGKTITALAAFDRMRKLGMIRRLLVVAPKSVLAAWQSDCTAFLGREYSVAVVTGNSVKRKRTIQRSTDILLVSYDTVVREEGLIRTITAASPMQYMLVLDESYFLKNPATARSRAINKIRPFCERAIVLCGTPAPNSSVDIVNQVDLADGGVAFADCLISKDPEIAHSTISGGLERTIFLRRLKEDVLPLLPAKQFERVNVNLRPLQKQLYESARDRLVLSVRSVDDREFNRNLRSFLAKRAVLLQICSNPISVDPLYSEQPAKLLALDRLLRDLIDQQNLKVVVWSFFRRSLNAIVERYRDYGLVRIDGSVSRIEDRRNAIDRFQNDAGIRLFVGNAAAAGAGITLTASHHAIYESFSNQAAHYMQSVDRIHRRGQQSEVINHIILANNTIEIPEFETILKKEKAGQELLGDPLRPIITRERFLAELDHA